MEYRQYRALQKCYPDGTPVEPPVYIKADTYEVTEYDTMEECETGIVIPKYCIDWKIMAGGNPAYVTINGEKYKLSAGIYYNGKFLGYTDRLEFCYKTEDPITSLKFEGQDLRYVDLCNFSTENITDTSDIFPTNSNLIEIVAPQEFLDSLPSHWQDPSIYLIPCGLENIVTWEGGETLYYYLNSTSPLYSETGYSLELGSTSTIVSLKFNTTQNSAEDNEITAIDISSIFKKYITTCSNMFATCSKLTTISLGEFNLPTDASGMFYGCYALETINGTINTSNVEDMGGMFYMCRNLNFDIIKTFNTNNVKSFSQMFYGCNNVVNLDLSNFTADSVTDLSQMFRTCTKLESLDLSNFDIIDASSINKTNMFQYCSKLNSIKCRQSFKDMCDNYTSTMGFTNYSNITFTIVD